ncbi:hypothetical protein OG689_41340 [Kitasatospora sp. NBC_00240]|uniref:hypothetical protein n=1 Tax=Kitasatospora sp. NBC_00240 TaxID=2903567 RepID=UPI002251EBA2|nr:hypothetical protein [Kitasatospora sp. NBC_00240]MCX5215601.1 hypothetical protein [Kitasatospora sp. NBC_00240]
MNSTLYCSPRSSHSAASALLPRCAPRSWISCSCASSSKLPISARRSGSTAERHTVPEPGSPASFISARSCAAMLGGWSSRRTHHRPSR